MLDRMDEDCDKTRKDHLAAVNRDLAIARERLVHYEAQRRCKRFGRMSLRVLNEWAITNEPRTNQLIRSSVEPTLTAIPS